MPDPVSVQLTYWRKLLAHPPDYLATLQADRQRSGTPGEPRSLELARFYDQQADRTHRRFLASVESLARVRKLIVPIQINIAEQQVNVAGSLAVGKGTPSELKRQSAACLVVSRNAHSQAGNTTSTASPQSNERRCCCII